jgi:hypothetical protein
MAVSGERGNCQGGKLADSFRPEDRAGLALENEDPLLKETIEKNQSVSPTDYIHRTARKIIVWSAILATATVGAIGVYPTMVSCIENKPWVTDLLQKHFAATAGLPCIAALSFLIVITFEARFDAIEMEFFGIVKFKGASGPIILWVLCVLTLASCVRMLW